MAEGRDLAGSTSITGAIWPYAPGATTRSVSGSFPASTRIREDGTQLRVQAMSMPPERSLAPVAGNASGCSA